MTIMIKIHIVHHPLLAGTFCRGDGKAFIYRSYHIVSWWLMIFLKGEIGRQPLKVPLCQSRVDLTSLIYFQFDDSGLKCMTTALN